MTPDERNRQRAATIHATQLDLAELHAAWLHERDQLSANPAASSPEWHALNAAWSRRLAAASLREHRP